MLLQIESGRVLIVPFRKIPNIPMVDMGFVSEPMPQTLCLLVEWSPVPGKPGSKEASQFFIGVRDFMKGKGFDSRLLKIYSPKLMLIDHCFYYQKIEKNTDSSRSLRACEGQRRVGTFRMQNTDMGASFRTGRRRCAYEVRQFDQGIAGKLTWFEDQESEGEGIEIAQSPDGTA